jgi:hypothetical protein
LRAEGARKAFVFLRVLCVLRGKYFSARNALDGAEPGNKNPAASFEAPGALSRDGDFCNAFDQTRQRQFDKISFVHGTFH